ncbi:MAG: aldolase [Alphaproteobacteria bacterium CG_4_10_14_0_2_um_filter_63_37]|nr:MAG: hypothetical protein AUJ55_01090 [Proteobacteria bacterium CG1_02_64_396]PJA25811.1 MAG: aldolase [Alphaproteobacteria bacterium CG_4_10_14_0_2_um_filter_63_37]
MNRQALLDAVANAIVLDNEEGAVTVLDAHRFRESMDLLAFEAAFGESAEVRALARTLIRNGGLQVGVFPASIHELYMAMGRGEVDGFTVPAVNIRGMTYQVARAMIRSASAIDAGAYIFEIARSEMGYTFQRPAEYAAVVLAAAIREGVEGPVFIQGDHFQANAKTYKNDPKAIIDGIKDLSREAIEAGFFNIDVDTSTLVDLSFPTVDEQQKLNYTHCAEISDFIRSVEPAGVTVSVGGEIGEVGHENSNIHELRAFLDGFNRDFGAMAPGKPGLSKLSVQTGTSHGGVPGPDGKILDVKLDFTTLEQLSIAARNEYGLGGCVQHGASTLPKEMFNRFPGTQTCEIHLATGFQNIIYDTLPAALVARIDALIAAQHADEKSGKDTQEQFIYKTRKKGFGHFKKVLWELSPEDQAPVIQALEDEFIYLFELLSVSGTKQIIAKTITRADAPTTLAVQLARAENDHVVEESLPGGE